DWRVLGRGAFLLNPKENCSYSKPSRKTPSFNRGVRIKRSKVSLSSKSSTRWGPRATLASPTNVSSNEYATGQKSVPNDPVAAVRKIATSNWRLKFRGITIQCALSLRKSAMDLAMSFIIADSEPSFSTPCKSESEADETMSPRQVRVCGLPFTSTGHI